MFLRSGTQANLIALISHCERGAEYIVDQKVHCYRWEAGGAAVVGSIQPQPVHQQVDGTLLLTDIEGAIKPDDAHFARTRLLTRVNTIGGKVLLVAFSQRLAAPCIGLTSAYTATAQRWVTHLDISREAVESALAFTQDFFSKR